MKTINEKQNLIIKSSAKIIRVIAGAGSGKTFTLIERIIDLIKNRQYLLEKFLILTFTNKAKEELNERLSNNLNNKLLKAHTYHSFCLLLLRNLPYSFSFYFTVIDKDDIKTLFKMFFKEQNLKLKNEVINIDDVLNFVYLIKSDNWLTLEEFLKQKEIIEKYNGHTHFALKKMFFFKLIEYQLLHKCLDFEDLLNYVCFFLKNEEIKKLWSNKYEYLYVDEFQDINHKQYFIVKKIYTNELFVVGDPDQCIYEWRGAKPSIMLEEFKKDFLNVQDFILDINYRSNKNILEAANVIIDKNTARVKKNLIANNPVSHKIVLKEFIYPEQEGDWIAERIKTLLLTNISPYNIAILYRANYTSRHIEMALIKKKINYVVYGGISFFQRKEIKEAIAYFKLLSVPTNLEIMRIINAPTRGIGDKTIENLYMQANNSGISLWEYLLTNYQNNKIDKKVTSWFKMVLKARESFNSESVDELYLYNYLNNFGYIDYLKNYDDNFEDRILNLKEFIGSLVEDIDWKDLTTLDNLLNEVFLLTDKNKHKDMNNQVKLMTIHSSKGLEFKVVFLPAWVDGVFPSARSLENMQLEEERRIAYVAITRAKDNLYISKYFMSRNQYFRESIFYKEIKDKNLC